MKKLILGLFLLIGLGQNCFASSALFNTMDSILNDSSGTLMKSYAIGSGATVNSAAIQQNDNSGYGALVVTITGNVAISLQVSNDNATWYTPYTTSGTTLTSVGPIVSALTSTRWIVITPQLAQYIRFVFVDSGSGSTVTVHYIYQH